MLTIAQNAKNASYLLASLPEQIKNAALAAVAENIKANQELILRENRKDLENSKDITKSLYDRLKLDEYKIDVIVKGIHDVINLEDPVNKILAATELDKELVLNKVSCPIGVIGVIFESRPDVVPQIAALAIKSANAVILKGGTEADNSNTVLVKVIHEALSRVVDFPANAVSLIKTRDDVKKMLEMSGYIDLIIPRGSNSLVKYIQENTKIPVLGHTEGICHIYIDEFADLEKAVKVTVDSKVQYPAACNAVETLLIHKNIAEKVLPRLLERFKQEEVTVKLENADWHTEYSDKIIAIKVVEDINEAINHINHYGSHHTDCIITEDTANMDLFMNLVDSAGVYCNASTRFADGFRYGFGAEVGISTNKTHARGPVGLEGLTIYKYRLYGSGQTVAEYSGKHAREFTHKKLIN
ncbi:MAG: glutamate-5-semialdehyde dehydrogenase [Candidatus Melainabacteria bacterium GWF2_37_15]|nr:MAG: glutamate-5-semialdehyde dehydrogenase [Candidatus Melainabacteria bacterium GWF2_37_15]